MSSARHRAPARDAAPKRFSSLTRLAVASTTVTATVVGVGLVGAGSSGPVEQQAAELSGHAGAALGAVDLDALASSREDRVSRTAQRVTLQPRATGHKFATAPLNIWTEPREQGEKLGVLSWGTRIAVTGESVGRWSEVLLKGKKGNVRARWVNGGYLANKKPEPEREERESRDATREPVYSGISGAPCPDGSAIEGGLTANAVRLYRAVCAAFPQPTTYGGRDPHGEHVDGRAIDIMVSGDLGWQIAEWLRANAGTLGVRNIIYAQRIWTPERASEGWRYMPSRGSATADHYDHVHVAVY
jgi:hypothetical protein